MIMIEGVFVEKNGLRINFNDNGDIIIEIYDNEFRQSFYEIINFEDFLDIVSKVLIWERGALGNALARMKKSEIKAQQKTLASPEPIKKMAEKDLKKIKEDELRTSKEYNLINKIIEALEDIKLIEKGIE